MTFTILRQKYRGQSVLLPIHFIWTDIRWSEDWNLELNVEGVFMEFPDLKQFIRDHISLYRLEVFKVIEGVIYM